jgi:hypothetical protein
MFGQNKSQHLQNREAHFRHVNNGPYPQALEFRSNFNIIVPAIPRSIQGLTHGFPVVIVYAIVYTCMLYLMSMRHIAKN